MITIAFPGYEARGVPLPGWRSAAGIRRTVDP